MGQLMVLPRAAIFGRAAGPAVVLQPPKLKLKSPREHAGHVETGRQEKGNKQGGAEYENLT